MAGSRGPTGEVVVLVDRVERVRSNGKSVAIERIPPDLREFSAQTQRATRKLEAAQIVEITPELQNLALASR